MESKIKHLEFIQNVISRMNSNSFLIKGWTITIVSALSALAAEDANVNYVYVSIVSVLVFWVLDGFYISQERQYRALYKIVTMKNESEIDFNMEASCFCNENRTWCAGIFSKTLIPFYGFSILIICIVIFILN
jgi:hypothetical protein